MNKKNKFNVNENVLYQNGDTFELGVVKEVLVKIQQGSYTSYHVSLKDLKSEEENFIDSFSYRVYYHTGDTTAITREDSLHKLINEYAFTIIRKSADNKDINICPARQMASRILGQFELYGDFYYKLEDWLTDFLEGNEHDLPYGIDSEYLRCALRLEFREFFDSFDITDIESSVIEACVDRAFNSFDRNVLDTGFIYDIAREYLDKDKDNIHYQIVYMYSSDTEEHTDDYSNSEFDSAYASYKYYVEHDDCSYVVLRKVEVIDDEEEITILEEYYSDAEE